MISRFGLILTFVFLISSAFTVKAEQTLSAPQACTPINPTQALEFEWREDAIYNLGSRTLWVVCPLTRAVNDIDYIVANMVFNLANSSQEMICYLREISQFGVTLTTVTRSEFLPSGQAGPLTYGATPVKEPGSTFSLTCSLPPSTGLGGIYTY